MAVTGGAAFASAEAMGTPEWWSADGGEGMSAPWELVGGETTSADQLYYVLAAPPQRQAAFASP